MTMHEQIALIHEYASTYKEGEEMMEELLLQFIQRAERLANEVLTLNPTSGELGQGKAIRLIELAEEVLDNE